MKTLYISKNLNQLNSILPEPQYESTASSLDLHSFSTDNPSAHKNNAIDTDKYPLKQIC